MADNAVSVSTQPTIEEGFISGAFYQRTATGRRPGRHVQQGDVYIAFDDTQGAVTRKRLVNLRSGNTTTWEKVSARVEKVSDPITITPSA